MSSIGARLKEWRLATGMKQDIAAIQMGMSRPTLSAIEAGKLEVLAKEIPQFAELYGRSPKALLEGLDWKENSRMMTEDMENFADRVTDELTDHLNERGFTNISIAVHDADQMADDYVSASIHDRTTGITVECNLTDMQKEVQRGGSFDAIVSLAADHIEGRFMMAQRIDIDALDDYEQIKDKLTMEVVATDRNKDILGKVPHVEMENLSVFYRILLGENEQGRNTVLVTNKMLEHYGITSEHSSERTRVKMRRNFCLPLSARFPKC